MMDSIVVIILVVLLVASFVGLVAFYFRAENIKEKCQETKEKLQEQKEETKRLNAELEKALGKISKISDSLREAESDKTEAQTQNLEALTELSEIKLLNKDLITLAEQYETFIFDVSTILTDDVDWLRGSMAKKLQLDIPEVQELYRGLESFKNKIVNIRELIEEAKNIRGKQ